MSALQHGNVASRPQTVAERKRTAALQTWVQIFTLVRTVANCTEKDLNFHPTDHRKRRVNYRTRFQKFVLITTTGKLLVENVQTSKE